MRQFVCGIMFTAGITLFGKSMYELGRLKEQKEQKEAANFVKELRATLKI